MADFDPDKLNAAFAKVFELTKPVNLFQREQEYCIFCGAEVFDRDYCWFHTAEDI